MNQEATTTNAPAIAPTSRGLASFTDQLIEPLSRLRSEVERVFDDFPLRLPTLQFGTMGAIFAAPAVDMKETAKAYKITAELPGIDPDEVEVTFEDGMLRIAGEKKEEREADERGYRVSERRYGAFERLIELPAAADDEKIKAKFKDGLLTITVAKNGRAEPQTRRIAVEKG
jgi:HSP20 family protein